MKIKLFILLATFLIILGCENIAIKTNQLNNVQLILEKDSIKIYKLYDGKTVIYYTSKGQITVTPYH